MNFDKTLEEILSKYPPRQQKIVSLYLKMPLAGVGKSLQGVSRQAASLSLKQVYSRIAGGALSSYFEEILSLKEGEVKYIDVSELSVKYKKIFMGIARQEYGYFFFEKSFLSSVMICQKKSARHLLLLEVEKVGLPLPLNTSSVNGSVDYLYMLFLASSDGWVVDYLRGGVLASKKHGLIPNMKFWTKKGPASVWDFYRRIYLVSPEYLSHKRIDTPSKLCEYLKINRSSVKEEKYKFIKVGKVDDMIVYDTKAFIESELYEEKVYIKTVDSLRGGSYVN